MSKKAKIGGQTYAEYHHIPILNSITLPNLTQPYKPTALAMRYTLALRVCLRVGARGAQEQISSRGSQKYFRLSYSALGFRPGLKPNTEYLDLKYFSLPLPKISTE